MLRRLKSLKDKVKHSLGRDERQQQEQHMAQDSSKWHGSRSGPTGVVDVYHHPDYEPRVQGNLLCADVELDAAGPAGADGLPQPSGSGRLAPFLRRSGNHRVTCGLQTQNSTPGTYSEEPSSVLVPTPPAERASASRLLPPRPQVLRLSCSGQDAPCHVVQYNNRPNSRQGQACEPTTDWVQSAFAANVVSASSASLDGTVIARTDRPSLTSDGMERSSAGSLRTSAHKLGSSNLLRAGGGVLPEVQGSPHKVNGPRRASMQL